MSVEQPSIGAIPTNIITGFLGAGKTTAILDLLSQKPVEERWAVLVNEFGEIGVDGSLVAGRAGEELGVYVREVPGGCMCCTAGLPMQIALNQLLRRARPHRLLIEPTGLGHPREVLQTLAANHNSEILSIEKTLTLVDARNLSDERYANHDTFRQQFSIADVVVANKDDLCEEGDRESLRAYVDQVCQSSVEIIHTQHGELSLDLLSGPTAMLVEPARHSGSHDTQPLMANELPFPPSGYVTAVNQGEGFESIGWRFAPQKTFDRTRLYSLLSSLEVERMKAVFITMDGVFGYNMTRDVLSETELDDCVESRIEIIAGTIDPDWVNSLTECLTE